MDDRIDERHIRTRTINAEITDVQTWSETSFGSSGGGGYVDPRYGAWFEPVRIWSDTNTIVRARLRFEDGGADSLDFPGQVRLSAGDGIVLVVAEEEVGRRWEYCGLANVTTGSVHYFGRLENVCPMFRRTRQEKLGRHWLMACVAWVVVWLAGMALLVDSRGAAENALLVFFLGMAAVIGGARKGDQAFIQRRAQAEQRYQTLFQQTCTTALAAFRPGTQGGRQAAPAAV